MKKQLILSFIFLLSISFYAQQEINTEFATKTNYLFGSLDKTKVPHGILLDYGMEFTNVPAYNGTLTDSTYTNSTRLEEIYKTLLSSRIRNVTTGFVTPNIYAKNIRDTRTRGVIVLGGLYFKYAEFDEDALLHQQITYANGKLYDKYINGVWQNPYLEKQTFAMTPFISTYSGLDLHVKIPTSIFYSNYQNQIQSIQIDFDNGNGYITVPFNQDIAVSYTVEGIKTWKYKLILSNGTTMYNQSKIKIDKGFKTVAYGTQNYQRTTQNGIDNYLHKTITASIPHLGGLGKVRLTIDLAPNHSVITKPLIVAEGFDVGVVVTPENECGLNNYKKDFKESLNTSGQQLYNLIGNEYTKQYDIIYVDWDNGVDYMQRNAYALEEVIKWVNSVKQGSEKNVVLGQSMGGVISRYALADMEQRGENHDTRLFISHDAPQQGANVPISLQYFYRHTKNQYVKSPLSLFSEFYIPLLNINNGVSPSDYLSLLDKPATKQLLKNRVTKNYTLDNNEHSSFYNELKNNGVSGSGGYPLNCRNIAISNGSECGVNQGFSQGDDLFKYKYHKGLSFLQDLASTAIFPFAGAILGVFIDVDFFGVAVLSLLPGHSIFDIDFQAKALYQNYGQQIYKGKISYTKKILWIISVTTNITNVQKNQPSGILPLDNYGGGYFDTSEIASNVSSSIYVRDKFSFIPTVSSLDIGNNNVTLIDADYKRSYVGGNPPTGSKSSPFANFSTDFDTNPNISNKPHISFNKRNGDWLANELEETPENTDCAAFCSSSKITGSKTLCLTEAYSITGNLSANWSVTTGSNLVTLLNNGNSVNLTIFNSNLSGEIVLKATISSEECGEKTITKRIWVGKPLNDLIMQSSGGYTLSTGSWYQLNALHQTVNNFAQNNLTYQWQIPYAQIRYSNNNKTAAVQPLQTGTYPYKLRAVNTCGCSSWKTKLFEVKNAPSGNGLFLSPSGN